MSNITITNEDYMKLMGRFPSKYFELAIPDPQYGIGEAGKNHKSRNTLVRQKDGMSMRRCPSTNYTRKNWDEKPPAPEYFVELKRVSIDQIIFGANYFESIMTVRKPPRRNEYSDFILQYPKGFIIWDKVNGSNDFSDCEVIYTSFDFPSFVLKYMWAGMMQGVSVARGTVMQGNKKLNEKRIHPTQKPVMLYEYLLNTFAKPGFKVLDTGFGSGSSAIACDNLGLDFTGCELDSEMFEKAKKRIGTHRQQQRLFIPQLISQ